MESVYDLDQLLDDMVDVYLEMPNEGAFLYLPPEDNMVSLTQFGFNVYSVIIPLI